MFQPSHESQLPLCPQCRASNVFWLAFTSTVNHVDCFQCLYCQHVWMTAHRVAAQPDRVPSPLQTSAG